MIEDDVSIFYSFASPSGKHRFFKAKIVNINKRTCLDKQNFTRGYTLYLTAAKYIDYMY